MFHASGSRIWRNIPRLSQILSDPRKKVASAHVSLNTTEGMIQGPESTYPIHPTALDACFQLGIIAAHGGHTSKLKVALVPVLIDEMTVWHRSSNQAIGFATAESEFKGLRGVHSRIQLSTPSGQPIFEISNMRSVHYSGGEISTPNTKALRSPYSRLVWKPDITTLSSHHARKLFPAPVSAIEIETVFDKMDLISACMIMDIAGRVLPSFSGHPHLDRFKTWIQRMVKGNHAFIKKASTMTMDQCSAIMKDLSTELKDIVDVKHTLRIYNALPQIFQGTVTGFDVAFQDGNLERVYSSGLGISAAYPQLENLLDLLGHKNPSMKILEVGAGTGSATAVALSTLGGAEVDAKRYHRYVFTDVSSRFLQPAKEKFANFKDVTYQTFDFNQDPEHQQVNSGFDLVIASECFHSAVNVEKALSYVRRLLNPGGFLLMIETTRTMLGHGIAYGTFPDYWPADEKKDSPFLTRAEWKYNLQKSGFWDIDVELDDYAAPYTVASTILTCAVVPTTNSIPPEKPTLHIICSSSEDVIGQVLSQELIKGGVQPVIVSLCDADLPDGSRVIMTCNFGNHVLVDGTEADFLKIKHTVSRSSSILFITDGDVLRGRNPKAAVVTGLVRMLTTEDSLSRYGIFHLEENWTPTNDAIVRLIIEREARLQAGDLESEIAMNDGIAHVGRLLIDRDLNDRYRTMYASKPAITKKAMNPEEPVQVNFESLGLVSSIYMEPDRSIDGPLPDTWIEVDTKSIGLNWKDIASSAGKLDISYISMEFAGIVKTCGSLVKDFHPGDRVYGLALRKFGSRLRMQDTHARLMRQTDKFEEAATLPVVFGTAVYALLYLARLKQNETVLIESATGGLGLAMIQIAQSVGGHIYVTVGKEEKIDYLVKNCGIDRSHIFPSRAASNPEAMMRQTRSKGFNVIISSSNGNTMQETAQCLAKRGRFIDVGRVDVQEHKALTMNMFEKNATFSSFDFAKIIGEEPEFAGQ